MKKRHKSLFDINRRTRIYVIAHTQDGILLQVILEQGLYGKFQIKRPLTA